jgi:K(+)-stimulated pyrophosphate-energized sodium pump
MDPLIITLSTIILAGILLVFIYRWVFSHGIERSAISNISDKIQKGTAAYLNTQFSVLLIMIPILAIVIFYTLGWKTSTTFVVGASMSILSAYAVMRLVIKVHGRVTDAARNSSLLAFRIAFMGGSLMGLSVPALSLAGVTILFIIFQDPNDLVGFGFGASLIALFAQVGGGIFTKAADIGADLVGKVEKGIPEDDPRNPAVIADLVGDNVGDCAGRGSDLFQSFSGDKITGMMLGVAFVWEYGYNAIIFPLLLPCVGFIASVIGVMLVKQLKFDPEKTITIGLGTTFILTTIGSYFLTIYFMGDVTIFYAIMSGLVAVLISIFVAQYYTGYQGKPVKSIAEASQRGSAINIITGLAYAFQNPLFPIAGVIGAAVFSYIISGYSLYAIAIANIATDLMIGFIMSADAFGPISDNANGVAEMAHEETAARNLTLLDAVGNSMKAYTKALSMTTGTLTAFAVFITFFELAGVKSLSLINPFNVAAIFVGVSVSFLVASLTIGSTAKTAMTMVDEVRKQFQNPGVMAGTVEPDYKGPINISTKAALREMIWPGLIAIIPTVIVGIFLGAETLVAYLIGITVSAVALAVFFNNGGAAFDNAKKLIETGLYGGKGSETHKAAVVGDTVGDPMKDVAGPSLIIFMKLVGLTALLILPILIGK